MRVSIGNLVENKRRSLGETRGSLLHSLAENHQFCGNPFLKWQFSMNRAIAIHQVGRISLVVELDPDRGKIVNPAYEQNCQLIAQIVRLVYLNDNVLEH